MDTQQQEAFAADRVGHPVILTITLKPEGTIPARHLEALRRRAQVSDEIDVALTWDAARKAAIIYLRGYFRALSFETGISRDELFRLHDYSAVWRGKKVF
jgi:hypothetical protein